MFDSFVETSEYSGEYVPPFVRIVLDFTWCRYIRCWAGLLGLSGIDVIGSATRDWMVTPRGVEEGCSAFERSRSTP